MNYESMKFFYAFSCAVLCLVVLSPTLAAIVTFPEGQKFSELGILGPNHMLEGYPFSISTNELCKVYLDLSNYMGGLEYYAVYVKLRNQSEPLPDPEAGLPSSLEPIFQYRIFLMDNATWEREFSFSFEDVSFEGNVSRVSRLSINGYDVSVNKVAVWDDANSGFYYQLFFELWIYNATASSFQFHKPFVGLWLNVTRPL